MVTVLDTVEDTVVDPEVVCEVVMDADTLAVTVLVRDVVGVTVAVLEADMVRETVSVELADVVAVEVCDVTEQSMNVPCRNLFTALFRCVAAALQSATLMSSVPWPQLNANATPGNLVISPYILFSTTTATLQSVGGTTVDTPCPASAQAKLPIALLVHSPSSLLSVKTC